jgi:beta-fructofuranosidase
MDRRAFLLSSTLSSLHLGTPLALRRVFQAGSADPKEELRMRLAGDPLRPQYHLLPQAGFLGDPCAPRFYRGQYHAFFHGSFGGRGWHHAISSDLVHWRHMPIALSPTENSYDSYGTFTGSVLPSDDGASIIYTGVTKVPREQETIRNEGLKEVQCVATSNDSELQTWHKLDKPIIEAPPTGKKITGFRDPFSWKEGDIWYAGVGSGFEREGGAVLLYRSKDARHWEYLHPLAQGKWNGKTFSNPVPSGEMWE